LRHGRVRQLSIERAETETLEAPAPATRQNDRWTFTGAVSPMPFSVPGTAYSPVTCTASARVIRVCGKANVAIAEQVWSKLGAV
jgi:hypothetical protein